MKVPPSTIVTVKVMTFLAAVLAFLLVLPRFFFGDIGHTLDHSWQISLELALKEGLVFGRDFIFTYGPLGNLASRLPFESSKFSFLLIDLFVYTNILVILGYVIKGAQSYFVPLFLLLIFYLLGTAMFYVDISIVLSLFALFYVLRFYRSQRLTHFIALLVPTILAFYIKLNTGLALLVILMLVITVTKWRSKDLRGAILLVGLVVGSIVVSTFFIPVDLDRYIVASLHIANGYNDAMYLTQPDKLHYVYRAGAIILLLGCFFLYLLSKYRMDIFPEVSAVAFLLFILFKQGFVRADEHLFVFFEYTPAFLGIWMLAGSKEIRSKLSVMTAVVMAICYQAKNVSFNPNLINQKLEGAERYLDEFAHGETIKSGSAEGPQSAKLPKEFISTIGNDGVDVIPQDISYVFYNNLKYNPRPVIQSYSAYTSYLDNLGAEKYSSSTAPQHIIYSHGCIDDRYCFFDESNTKLAILSNYRVGTRVDNKILLSKVSSDKSYAKKEIASSEATLGQKVRLPPSSRPVFLYSNIRYSLIGKIVRFFYKPPPLTIRFKTANGWSRKFRLIMPLQENGLLINKFIDSLDDDQNFFEGNFGRMNEVTEFRINSTSQWAYGKKFDYKLKELEPIR